MRIFRAGSAESALDRAEPRSGRGNAGLGWIPGARRVEDLIFMKRIDLIRTIEGFGCVLI